MYSSICKHSSPWMNMKMKFLLVDGNMARSCTAEFSLAASHAKDACAPFFFLFFIKGEDRECYLASDRQARTAMAALSGASCRLLESGSVFSSVSPCAMWLRTLISLLNREAIFSTPTSPPTDSGNFDQFSFVGS